MYQSANSPIRSGGGFASRRCCAILLVDGARLRQSSIRKIMLRAAQAYAAAIIAVHNHPSGDPTSSEQDKLLTRDLVIAG